MKQTIIIKIGVGTYSYIMGGSELIDIEDHLPEEIKKYVSVEGAIYIDGCEKESGKTPPFASINGIIMENASKKKIINEINNILRNKKITIK